MSEKQSPKRVDNPYEVLEGHIDESDPISGNVTHEPVWLDQTRLDEKTPVINPLLGRAIQTGRGLARGVLVCRGGEGIAGYLPDGSVWCGRCLLTVRESEEN